MRAVLLIALVGCSSPSEPKAAKPACPSGAVQHDIAKPDMPRDSFRLCIQIVVKH